MTATGEMARETERQRQRGRDEGGGGEGGIRPRPRPLPTCDARIGERVVFPGLRGCQPLRGPLPSAPSNGSRAVLS